jgi:hypothetical protein
MHPARFALTIAFFSVVYTAPAFAQFRMLPDDAFLVSGSELRAQIASDRSIPRRLWGAPIQQLNPIRVYRRGVNIAVVTSENEREERGVYFQVPESSYLPVNKPGMEYRWNSEKSLLEYVFAK